MATIEQMRAEAAAVIAEMHPLKERLAELNARHGELAWQIEQESRRQAVVRKMPYIGPEGKQPAKRKRQKANILGQLAQLTEAEQQALLEKLQARMG